VVTVLKQQIVRYIEEERRPLRLRLRLRIRDGGALAEADHDQDSEDQGEACHDGVDRLLVTVNLYSWRMSRCYDVDIQIGLHWIRIRERLEFGRAGFLEKVADLKWKVTEKFT